MKNTFFLLWVIPFVSCAQPNDKIQVLITNDFDKPITVAYLDDANKETKVVVDSHDMILYKINPEQFLHLKPRFFELDGKVYQMKFSIPSADKYKIEVWDAIKRANDIKLGNKTHSLFINNKQTLYININKKGILSFGVVEKKKLA